MAVLLLGISTFLGVMLIVMASTTVYIVEYTMLEKKIKKREEEERGLQVSRIKKRKLIAKPELEKRDKLVPSIRQVEEIPKTLEEDLKDIDQKLSQYTDLEKCLIRLRDLSSEYPNNSQILWRLGEVYEKLAERTDNITTRKNLIDAGIEACGQSLLINFEQPQAHKWMAALVGYKGQTQPTKQKLEFGKLFKHHLDIALSLDPTDPIVQHMAGRFCFEIASLKWIERKLADAAFSDHLDCSYDKALGYFTQSEKLSKYESKENRLYIAKCYMGKEDYRRAVEWLEKAKSSSDDYAAPKISTEIDSLLAKLSNHM